MPSCLETFCESGFSHLNLQLLVDQLHPDCECEAEKCSIHSPGPVLAKEKIAFLLIDPLHYDPDSRKVVPAAFQELTRRDLSTLRIAFASSEQLEATKEILVSRSRSGARTISEVCVADVEDLRAATESGHRCFAVYDTALEEVPAHASIFARSDILIDRKKRKLARYLIHSIFSKDIYPYMELAADLA